ncbi:MAG TPA: hypothetical protein VFJ16_31075, partial [Longimicrobium sp.]|nr:hypothetical protein [Longimicrobium sp.]
MPLELTRYPPPHGPLLLPVRSPATAAAAVALEAGCRPAALLARRAAAAWIAHGGARVLPPRVVSWTPPMPAEAWAALLARLREVAGAFDAVAVWERRQPGRGGVGLLLGGARGPRAFVKLRPAPAPGLEMEARVLRAAATAAPRAFRLPALLGAGGDGAWRWIALEVIPPFHRVPRRPPIGRVAAGVAALLRHFPAAGAPPHWAPMHGDLTPWNLREDAAGRLWLYDWERAGWGPPGADAVLYHATAAAVRAGPAPDARAAAARWPEAAAWWARRFLARPASTR